MCGRQRLHDFSVSTSLRHIRSITAKMSLVSSEKSNFQFILRLLNTNVRQNDPRAEMRARAA